MPSETCWKRRIVLLGALLGVAAAQAAETRLPAMAPVTAQDSLLIVAPHPDDESLCCAGLIHMARQAGARVAIVWITNGDGSRSDTSTTRARPRRPFRLWPASGCRSPATALGTSSRG